MKAIPVTITVTDPWDAGEAVNWRQIPGQILRFAAVQGRDQALLRFGQPIKYRGSVYSYAVALPRAIGRQMAEIKDGRSVSAAVTAIPEQQAESQTPFDISGWRGGLAMIADIEPVRDDATGDVKGTEK